MVPKPPRLGDAPPEDQPGAEKEAKKRPRVATSDSARGNLKDMQTSGLDTIRSLGRNPLNWLLFIVKKVKGARKAVKDFGANAKFFQYDPKSLAQFDKDTGDASKAGGLVKRAQAALKKSARLLMLLIILQVLRLYMDLLGTEKSQNLQYVRHQNLTYKTEDIPRLLPAHGFVFFDTKQLENQIKCKMYWDVAACSVIETKKCLAEGETSISYELCMIALGRKVGLNTTEFCEGHYQNLPIWTGKAHPDNLYHHLRKHLCYYNSGQEYGRSYCDDYYKYAPAWGQEELWSCYAKHNVDFADEYCSTKFGTAGETFLKCKAQRGSIKDEGYCKYTFTEEAYPHDNEWLAKRVECYDELAIESVSYCRLKQLLSFSQGTTSRAERLAQLKECLEQVSGGPVTRDFCETFYQDQSLDERYDNCYAAIGLSRDRAYCEAKHPRDTDLKYICAFCLVADPSTGDDAAALNRCEESTDRDTILTGVGGDYCEYKFPNPASYAERHACLAGAGVPKTTEHCVEEYVQKYFEATVLEGASQDSEEVEALLAAKYACFADFGLEYVENDCASIVLREPEATYGQVSRPATSLELSKNMLTGEHNFRVNLTAQLERITEKLVPKSSNEQSDPDDFFTSLEFFFIGSYNSFWLQDGQPDREPLFVWVLEPQYEDFVRDRLILTDPTALGSGSFGKFLYRRAPLLSYDEVRATAERLYILKQQYDDPLFDAAFLDFSALVNDYSPKPDFSVRSAADKVTGLLGACYGSFYFGRIISDIDALFYYNRNLEADSVVFALVEQALSEPHGDRPVALLLSEAQAGTPVGQLREELLALGSDPLTEELLAEKLDLSAAEAALKGLYGVSLASTKLAQWYFQTAPDSMPRKALQTIEALLEGSDITKITALQSSEGAEQGQSGGRRRLQASQAGAGSPTGLTLSELQAKLEQIPMFEYSLGFIPVFGGFSPREIAALVRRMGLSLDSFDVNTVDLLVADATATFGGYSGVRGYSEVTFELLEATILKDYTDSQIAQIENEVVETLQKDVTKEDSLSRVIEVLLQKPHIAYSLKEVSKMLSSEQGLTLLSRNTSLHAYGYVLTYLREHAVLHPLASQFDTLSESKLSGQIIRELNLTIAGGLYPSELDVRGPSFRVALDEILAAPTTAKLVEELKSALESTVSAPARQTFAELQMPFFSRNVLQEAGLWAWLQGKGFSKDYTKDFGFRVCSPEGESCECPSGVLAFTPITRDPEDVVSSDELDWAYFGERALVECSSSLFGELSPSSPHHCLCLFRNCTVWTQFQNDAGDCEDCPPYSHQDPEDPFVCTSDACSFTEYQHLNGTCGACPLYSHQDPEEQSECTTDSCTATQRIAENGTCIDCPAFWRQDPDAPHLCFADVCKASLKLVLITEPGYKFDWEEFVDQLGTEGDFETELTEEFSNSTTHPAPAHMAYYPLQGRIFQALDTNLDGNLSQSELNTTLDALDLDEPLDELVFGLETLQNLGEDGIDFLRFFELTKKNPTLVSHTVIYHITTYDSETAEQFEQKVFDFFTQNQADFGVEIDQVEIQGCQSLQPNMLILNGKTLDSEPISLTSGKQFTDISIILEVSDHFTYFDVYKVAYQMGIECIACFSLQNEQYFNTSESLGNQQYKVFNYRIELENLKQIGQYENSTINYFTKDQADLGTIIKEVKIQNPIFGDILIVQNGIIVLSGFEKIVLSSGQRMFMVSAFLQVQNSQYSFELEKIRKQMLIDCLNCFKLENQQISPNMNSNNNFDFQLTYSITAINENISQNYQDQTIQYFAGDEADLGAQIIDLYMVDQAGNILQIVQEQIVVVEGYQPLQLSSGRQPIFVSIIIKKEDENFIFDINEVANQFNIDCINCYEQLQTLNIEQNDNQNQSLVQIDYVVYSIDKNEAQLSADQTIQFYSTNQADFGVKIVDIKLNFNQQDTQIAENGFIIYPGFEGTKLSSGQYVTTIELTLISEFTEQNIDLNLIEKQIGLSNCSGCLVITNSTIASVESDKSPYSFNVTYIRTQKRRRDTEIYGNATIHYYSQNMADLGLKIVNAKITDFEFNSIMLINNGLSVYGDNAGTIIQSGNYQLHVTISIQSEGQNQIDYDIIPEQMGLDMNQNQFRLVEEYQTQNLTIFYIIQSRFKANNYEAQELTIFYYANDEADLGSAIINASFINIQGENIVIIQDGIVVYEDFQGNVLTRGKESTSELIVNIIELADAQIPIYLKEDITATLSNQESQQSNGFLYKLFTKLSNTQGSDQIRFSELIIINFEKQIQEQVVPIFKSIKESYMFIALMKRTLNFSDSLFLLEALEQKDPAYKAVISYIKVKQNERLIDQVTGELMSVILQENIRYGQFQDALQSKQACQRIFSEFKMISNIEYNKLLNMFVGNPQTPRISTGFIITYNADFLEFNTNQRSEEHITYIADLLDISESKIQIVEVTEGSTIVEYKINADDQLFQKSIEQLQDEIVIYLIQEKFQPGEQILNASIKDQADTEEERLFQIILDSKVTQDAFNYVNTTLENESYFSEIVRQLDINQIAQKVNTIYQTSSQFCSYQGRYCQCPIGSSIYFGQKQQNHWMNFQQIIFDANLPYIEQKAFSEFTVCNPSHFQQDPTPFVEKYCFCNRILLENESEENISDDNFILKNQIQQQNTQISVIQKQTSYCSNEGQICECSSFRGDVYFATRDENIYLNNQGHIEVDLWNVYSKRNNLNIFRCSSYEFGITSREDLPYYCFCTDYGQSPMVYTEDQQYFFIFEQLQTYTQLKNLIYSFFEHEENENQQHSDNMIKQIIYEDLLNTLEKDCNQFQLQKNPEILLISWIQESSTLQTIISQSLQFIQDVETAGYLRKINLLDEFTFEELLLMSIPSQKQQIINQFQRINNFEKISDIIQVLKSFMIGEYRDNFFQIHVQKDDINEAFFQLVNAKVIKDSLELRQKVDCITFDQAEELKNALLSSSVFSLLFERNQQNFITTKQNLQQIKRDARMLHFNENFGFQIENEPLQIQKDWIYSSQALQNVILETEQIIQSSQFYKNGIYNSKISIYILQDINQKIKNDSMVNKMQKTIFSQFEENDILKFENIFKQDKNPSLQEVFETMIRTKNMDQQVFQQLFKDIDNIQEIDCPKHQYLSNNGICLDCDDYTYQDQENQTRCISDKCTNQFKLIHPYEFYQGGLVTVKENIFIINKTQTECKIICDSDPLCLSFGVTNYTNFTNTTQQGFQENLCILLEFNEISESSFSIVINNSLFVTNIDGNKAIQDYLPEFSQQFQENEINESFLYSFDLFIKQEQVKVFEYIQYKSSQINGGNLEFISQTTFDQCRKVCDSNQDCLSFEYIQNNEQSEQQSYSDQIKIGDCQIKSSANISVFYSQQLKSDVYIKSMKILQSVNINGKCSNCPEFTHQEPLNDRICISENCTFLSALSIDGTCKLCQNFTHQNPLNLSECVSDDCGFQEKLAADGTCEACPEYHHQNPDNIKSECVMDICTECPSIDTQDVDQNISNINEDSNRRRLNQSFNKYRYLEEEVYQNDNIQSSFENSTYQCIEKKVLASNGTCIQCPDYFHADSNGVVCKQEECNLIKNITTIAEIQNESSSFNVSDEVQNETLSQGSEIENQNISLFQEIVTGSYKYQFVDINGTCSQCNQYYRQDPNDKTICFQDNCNSTSILTDGGFCKKCPEYTHRDYENNTLCSQDICADLIEKLNINGTCEQCPDFHTVTNNGLECIENDCANTFYSTRKQGCLECEIYWRQDPDDSTRCITSPCNSRQYLRTDGLCGQCPDYTHQDPLDHTNAACAAEICFDLGFVERLTIDGWCEVIPHAEKVEHYKPWEDPQYDGQITDWDAYLLEIENPEEQDNTGMAQQIFFSDIKNSVNSTLRTYPILWQLLVYINTDDARPYPGGTPPFNFYMDTLREDMRKLFLSGNDQSYMNTQCDKLYNDPVQLIDQFMRDSWVLQLVILDLDDVLVKTSVGIISIDLVQGMLDTNAIEDPWVVARINTLIESLIIAYEKHPKTAHYINDVALGTNQGIQSKLLALATIDYTENRSPNDPFDGVAGVAFNEIVTNAISRGSLPFCEGYSDIFGYRRRQLNIQQQSTLSNMANSKIDGFDRRFLVDSQEKIEQHAFDVGYWYFEHQNKIIAILDQDNKKNIAPIHISLDQSKQSSLQISTQTNNESPLNLIFNFKDFSRDNMQDLIISRSTLLNISLKKAMDEIIVQNMQKGDFPSYNCNFAGPKNHNEFAWIRINLDQEQIIYQVTLFNIQNGARSSLLEGSTIYVGEQKCAVVGSELPVNQYLTFTCEDPQAERPNVFSENVLRYYPGTKGKFIKILASKPGILAVCDISVTVSEELQDEQMEQIQAQKIQCYGYWAQCRSSFNGTQGNENLYNCLEMFGFNKTAQFCLEEQRVQLEKYYHYPLKNKYQCLSATQGPGSNVTIFQKASECLNKFFDFEIEKCLQVLETEFDNEIGFIGSLSPPNELNPLAWKDIYFTTYGNRTLSKKELEMEAKIQMAKNGQDLITADARSGGYQINFDSIQIDKFFEIFLCNNKTDLVFISNPFDETSTSEDQPALNELVVNFGCEMFFISDTEKKSNQTVLHYFMDQNLDIRKINSGGPLNDSMFFINKTTLNKQEFQLTFKKDLEFLDVLKTELYMFTQDSQWQQVLVPKISSLDEYNDFRSQNNTKIIAHSETQTVGQHKMELTFLEANPYTFTFIDVPKRQTKRVPIFGWPLEWISRIVNREIQISPNYDQRKVQDMSEYERKADCFTNKFGIKIRFLELKFTFSYVSLKDIASQLGGAQGAASGATKGLGAIFTLLFVADLVRMLKAKRNHEYNTFKCRQLQKRLPLYRATIDVLIQKKAFEQIPEIELKKDLDKIAEYTEPSEEEQKAIEIKKKLEEEAKRKEDEEREGAFVILVKMAWSKFVLYLAAQVPSTVKEFWEELKPRVLACLSKIFPCIQEPQISAKEEKEKPPPTQEEKIEFLDYLESKYGEMSRKCVVNQDIADDYFLKNKALKKATEQGFLATTLQLKKRVSFLGLYNMHERSEMIHHESKRLTENRLIGIVKRYDHHQSLLLHYQKIKWSTGKSKLFTSSLVTVGQFNQKLIMDQKPENLNQKFT